MREIMLRREENIQKERGRERGDTRQWEAINRYESEK